MTTSTPIPRTRLPRFVEFAAEHPEVAAGTVAGVLAEWVSA